MRNARGAVRELCVERIALLAPLHVVRVGAERRSPRDERRAVEARSDAGGRDQPALRGEARGERRAAGDEGRLAALAEAHRRGPGTDLLRKLEVAVDEVAGHPEHGLAGAVRLLERRREADRVAGDARDRDRFLVRRVADRRPRRRSRSRPGPRSRPASAPIAADRKRGRRERRRADRLDGNDGPVVAALRPVRVPEIDGRAAVAADGDRAGVPGCCRGVVGVAGGRRRRRSRSAGGRRRRRLRQRLVRLTDVAVVHLAVRLGRRRRGTSIARLRECRPSRGQRERAVRARRVRGPTDRRLREDAVQAVAVGEDVDAEELGVAPSTSGCRCTVNAGISRCAAAARSPSETTSETVRAADRRRRRKRRVDEA